VEANQRYCVVCGTRRKHAHDPAARFLAGATSRARASGRGTPGSTTRGRRSAGLGTALVLAIIPLAVGLGVLIGRASNSQDDKLLAALRAEKPEVVNVGGGGATTAAASSTPVATLSSDFPLQSGYAVELSTLRAGATQAQATTAETAAKGKGATAVGLISQSDFTVTPSPPAGAYVIYAGAYKAKAAAAGELARLKKKFPGAQVIAVRSTSSADVGKTLATTKYGTVHSAVGFKPTASQLATGGAIVKKIASTYGKSYVGSQIGLPTQISVP